MDNLSNAAFGLVLIAPVSPTAGLTLTLASGQGARFPAANFNIYICAAGATPEQMAAHYEIARCSTRTGDVLTLSARAQEGSSARTILVGDQVRQAVTAKLFTDLVTAIAAVPVLTPGSSMSLVGTTMNTIQDIRLSASPRFANLRVDGRTVLFDPTASDLAAGPFSCAASSHPLTNGPAGEHYTDHVMSWGWNVKSPTIQDVAGVPAFCMSIESKFYGGDGYGALSYNTEWQLRGIRADGTQFRPFEIDCPHDGSGNLAGFRIARTYWGTETVGEDLASTAVVDLKPLGSETSGESILWVYPLVSSVSGGRAISVGYPVQTAKTQIGLSIDGNTTWNVTSQITNSNFSAGTAASMEALAGSAGVAFFAAIDAQTGDAWSWGKDASGNFALAANPQPTANVALTVNKTSLNVGLGTTVPVKRLTVFVPDESLQFRAGYSDTYYWDFGRDGSTGDFAFLRAGTPCVSFGSGGSVTAVGSINGASYKVGGVSGIDFSGPVTSITVVKGIVTAAS